MVKCNKGIIGEPIFNIGDKVDFDAMIGDMKIILEGEIYIVDSHGTFEQNEEPSYDIMVCNFGGSDTDMLFKHIRESWCYNNE